MVRPGENRTTGYVSFGSQEFGWEQNTISRDAKIPAGTP